MAEKEMKIDKVTGEVIEEKKIKKEKVEEKEVNSLFFDPYAADDEDASEGNESNYADEGERRVFYPRGMFIVRNETNPDDLNKETKYFDYATGINTVLGDEKVSFTLWLKPELSTKTTFKVLDLIYGADRARPLEIVRRSNTVTRGGKTRTTYSYNFRVSGVDTDGSPVFVTFKPVAKSGDVVDTILAKLKSIGELS